MLFVLKVAILLLQHLLVVVQESPEVVQLTILQNLEAVESGCDFLGRRYFLHLGD